LDTARWSRVRELLEAALEREALEREPFVRRACGGDGDLARSVLELLACDDAAHVLEPAATASWSTRCAPETPLVGAHLGRYRILRVIGYGGMGTVYEAEQQQPRRTVALKVMRPSLATPHALRRFEFEAQVLARLHHPSIAAVFEAGTHNPDPADPSRAVPYFAMELVRDAAPITDFARARGLSVRERLELFAQVCDAVHHGHQQGVIHRDLKPGNVLVDADGRPRIIDFGIARTLEPDAAATHGGAQAVAGTLQYMSPEQCAPGEGVDTRADVYSLGVVLYELLGRRPPYAVEGVSLPEAMRRVLEVDPPPLGELDPALRGDVETIVRRAMEKRKEDRYPAAASLAADIRHWLRSEPISARPPTAMYHLRTFARRNKPLVASAAVVLVVLLVGIVVTSVAWRSAREEARRARRIADFYKDTITAGIPYLARDLAAPADWWEDPPEPRAATSPAPQSFAVPDLLEEVGSRLDASFADEPEIRGELEDTLGRTLLYMGRERGPELLAKAIETRERTLGPDHPDTIRSRLAYADWIEGKGQYEEAERHFRATLDSCERTFGSDDPRTIAVERRLASNVTWSDRDRGFVLVRRALDHAERALGDDDRQTLIARGSLATILLIQGRLPEAEAAAREALAGWARVSGERSLEAAQASIALSVILRSESAFAESESLLRAGLGVVCEQLGGDIVHTLPWELQLVHFLRRTSRPVEAAAEMRRLVDAARIAFGEENSHVMKLEVTFARTLCEEGTELEEAERIARDAARGLMANLGPNDLNTVLAADTLHDVIRARGRGEEAAALATELLRDVRERGISEEFALTMLHQTLGECALDVGDLETAAAELNEAWDVAEDGAAYAGDPCHPRRLALMAALARVEDARGHAAEAAAWRARLPARSGDAR
jgi:serine/threonine protein kinase/tetratricopeptide (TPR) repeat protein